jgi:hypothetical protein
MKLRLFILALLIFCLNTTIFSQDVLQWGIFEKTLHSTTAYADSIKYALPISATFSGPDGRNYTVPGFWDGDSTWRIRFSPDTVGFWTYSIFSTDSLLNDISNDGNFNCILPSPSDLNNNVNYRGFLKVDDSKRKIVYHDGTPFFWLGETLWDGNSYNMGLDSDFKTCIDDRANKGFSVMQILVAEPPDENGGRHTGHNENGYAFTNAWSEINPSSFQNFDMRIQYIVNKGMVPCIFFFWGRELTYFNADIENYIRYIIARYQAYNVIWCVSGEYHYGNIDNCRLAGQFVQSINGLHHLVTIHPGPNDVNYSSMEDFQNDKWIDVQMQQVWWQPIDVYALNDYNKLTNPGPAKPLVFGEGMYDDPNSDASRERRPAWQAILNGCAGFTYGASGIWDWTPGNITLLNLQGCLQTVYMANFMKSIKWEKLIPGKNVVSDLSSAYSQEDIVVFFGRSSSKDINCSVLDGIANVRWLNAENGHYISQGNLAMGRIIHFKSPDVSNDMVLLLHIDTNPDTVPPSIPRSLQVDSTHTTSITLSWSTSMDDRGVEKYLVYKNQDTIDVAETNDTTITISGLLPNTNYSFRVSAKDIAWNESEKSAPIIVKKN